MNKKLEAKLRELASGFSQYVPDVGHAWDRKCDPVTQALAKAVIEADYWFHYDHLDWNKTMNDLSRDLGIEP